MLVHSYFLVLLAVEDVGLPINGIMGTSAGALIGSMYAAGYTPREVSGPGLVTPPAHLPCTTCPVHCLPPIPSPACSLSVQIVAEFSKHAPIDRLKCHGRPWEGVLSMAPLIEELQALLPGSFAELNRGEQG